MLLYSLSLAKSIGVLSFLSLIVRSAPFISNLRTTLELPYKKLIKLIYFDIKKQKGD
jgi:hypothetical protein